MDKLVSKNTIFYTIFSKENRTPKFGKAELKSLKFSSLKWDLAHQNRSRISPILIVDVNRYKTKGNK